jgi:hypothetical protein
MNKLESKLKDLNQMLIDDGYNGSNIVIQTLEEIREEAINYTHCCPELKAFKDEFIEAWEDGSGGDSDLYRKAKSL